MRRGLFITFEGGEGAGKSTQARLLKERIEASRRAVVLTREPGGTPFAEQVRSLLVDPGTAPHSALSETLLFYAARADHLEKVIRPALAGGRIVICDRFSDSTRVYQGEAGGVPAATLEALERLIVAETRPDLTLVLDLPVAEGLARATQRRELAKTVVADAYEKRPGAFHERLRRGFLAIAAAEPERCIVIDASEGAQAVAARVWAAVEPRLKDAGG
jgi:dTMP kinase